MKQTRREFELGTLIAHGDRFEFLPASQEDELYGHLGDIVDFYLKYDYHEASLKKETFDLRFTVELDGIKLGTQSTHVEDQRLIPNEEWGQLKHEVQLSKKGELKGRFTIDALYSKRAWRAKGDVATVGFNKKGEFTFTVR